MIPGFGSTANGMPPFGEAHPSRERVRGVLCHTCDARKLDRSHAERGPGHADGGDHGSVAAPYRRGDGIEALLELLDRLRIAARADLRQLRAKLVAVGDRVPRESLERQGKQALPRLVI